MANAFVLRYDRRIRRPRWAMPFFDGVVVHVPLSELDRDIDAAGLLAGASVRNMTFLNRRNGTGELLFFGTRGLGTLHAQIRYSDGIQFVDDEIRTTILPGGPLSAQFLPSGILRMDAPAPLAVTAALEDPRFYGIRPVGAGERLRIVAVRRQRRRRDPGTRELVAVAEPTYLEFTLEPRVAGTFRLEIPPLRTAAGGFVGPSAPIFTARVVKRAFLERTLGPFAPRPGTPADVVLGALAAEDDRIGGAHG